MSEDASDIEYAQMNGFEDFLGVPIAAQPNDKSLNERVDPDIENPYAPEVNDLVRLHKLVRSRKVTTILEFGVGHSSHILADALRRNKDDHLSFVSENLRRNNLFELHCVDANERYIKQTEKRVPDTISDLVKFYYSRCSLGTFNDRICHYYDKLPNICPDFIYLDAPHQFDVDGEIGGISIQHPDRLPMGGDLLRIEQFLLPGTMILVDGRSANARFLRSNFQRNWFYQHDEMNDVHYFELIEAPLGKYNERQIRYCLGERYFDKLKTFA